MPIFYLPEKAAEVWGGALAEGAAKRDPSLGPLDVIAQAPLAIGDDVERPARPSAGRSWPCTSAGWARAAATSTTTWPAGSATRPRPRRSRTLYLDGRKAEAAALVPADLVERTSLIGPESYVRERLAAYREAGVTTLNVNPLAPTHEARVRLIEQVRGFAEETR